MTNLITTSETDLMRKGDKCTYVTCQAFKPEYHITKEKVYDGVLTSAYTSSANCEFINDAGTLIEEDMVLGGFAGNSAVIKVYITPEDYKYRVMEANAKAVAKAEQDHQEQLGRLKAYCDKRLEKLIVTN